MALIINGVSLPPGSKQYWGTTHVRDIYMNGTHVYHYDSTPPTITITSSTATTSNPNYTLTGTVTDEHSAIATVTINGQAVALSGSNFSKAFYLTEGMNTFTVVATDAAGNSNSVSVTFRYVNTDPSRTDLLAPENEVEEHVGDFYITTNTNSEGEMYYRFTQRDKPGGASMDTTFTVVIPKGAKTITYTAKKEQGFQFPDGFTVNITDTTTSTVLYSTTAPSASGIHQTYTSGTYTISEDITYTHNITISARIQGNSYAETWGGSVGGGFQALTASYYL